VPTDTQLIARLDLVTDKLSTQVRTLAVGLLAFAGGLLLTGVTKPNSQGIQLPTWLQLRLFSIATLALLTLLFDVLQYVSAYKSGVETRTRLRRKIAAETNEDAPATVNTIEIGYDENSFWYKGITAFFWLKIVLLISATVWLTIVAAVFLYKKP